MSVIELKNISRVYGFGDATTLALSDVCLEIQKGEFVAIMGPSGSGKSTLMNIMGMLDTPSQGQYKLDSRKVAHISQRKRAKLRRDKVGFIFQSFNLLPKLTAIENVALPLTYKGVRHVKRLERAAKMLENVDLGTRQYYMPNQLSGGQAQRVAIARALINKPAIVLADEPTGNLDTASSVKIMEFLKEIHEAGNTIIMVTHNPELAEYAERFILLRDGAIELDTIDYREMTKNIMKSKREAKAEAVQDAQEEKEARVERILSTKPEKNSKKEKKETKKKSSSDEPEKNDDKAAIVKDLKKKGKKKNKKKGKKR